VARGTRVLDVPPPRPTPQPAVWRSTCSVVPVAVLPHPYFRLHLALRRGCHPAVTVFR